MALLDTIKKLFGGGKKEETANESAPVKEVATETASEEEAQVEEASTEEVSEGKEY